MNKPKIEPCNSNNATTVIDNFNIIHSLISICEQDNLFLHLQILRRGKDHPNLPAANKLIKTWLIRSREQFNSIRDDIVILCTSYGARAYINLSPKSFARLNTLILTKLADNIHTGNIVNPWYIFNSACGELQGVVKLWVIDIDSKEENLIADVKTRIKLLWQQSGNSDKDFYAEIPTHQGIHLISPPFNLQIFKTFFPDIGVKKNNPTLLYMPDLTVKTT